MNRGEFLAGLTAAASVGDYGPSREVRAIRHDVPILARRFVGDRPVTVREVNVNGNQASATFTVGTSARLEVFALHYRSDRWWYDSGSLVDDACARCPAYIYSNDDGYQAKLLLREADANASLIVGFHGRAPTVAEMPPAPSMNGLYFFDLVTDATTPVNLQAGSSLDVWFPFVLDPDQRYVLWLAFVDPEIARIPGTLKDNALHFEFPAFATRPGKTALGEIDVVLKP